MEPQIAPIPTATEKGTTIPKWMSTVPPISKPAKATAALVKTTSNAESTAFFIGTFPATVSAGTTTKPPPAPMSAVSAPTPTASAARRPGFPSTEDDDSSRGGEEETEPEEGATDAHMLKAEATAKQPKRLNRTALGTALATRVVAKDEAPAITAKGAATLRSTLLSSSPPSLLVVLLING